MGQDEPAAAAKGGGEFLTGRLLIAMPAMGDPRFAHSVIFLCAHTADGAMGIVLNQPVAQPSFEDLLAQLEVEPLPPARSIRICVGGPVDHGRGLVLHTADWTCEDSLKVDGKVALTADRSQVKSAEDLINFMEDVAHPGGLPGLRATGEAEQRAR